MCSLVAFSAIALNALCYIFAIYASSNGHRIAGIVSACLGLGTVLIPVFWYKQGWFKKALKAGYSLAVSVAGARIGGIDDKLADESPAEVYWWNMGEKSWVGAVFVGFICLMVFLSAAE